MYYFNLPSCAGTLISEDYVLTAAQCVDGVFPYVILNASLFPFVINHFYRSSCVGIAFMSLTTHSILTIAYGSVHLKLFHASVNTPKWLRVNHTPDLYQKDALSNVKLLIIHN